MKSRILGIGAAALVATVAFSATPVEARKHGQRWKTVCKTQWVHHRKVKRCHKVRVRW
ncbi:hypothetical protein [Sphingomonas sp.]|uniref:hypothetical protein n=1 Tax=Sphingomonas sp. TaxID=28214 RepID=UPI002CBF1346|nr:hypothetical protein [Sphingomonas sp.]HWK37102.1 hypothetical protein [Sphingomonas sp.]